MAALMCGVATLLFQTRVDLRGRVCGADDHFLNTGDLKLVDELFAQVMWSILSGFLLVFLLLMKNALAGILGELDLLVRWIRVHLVPGGQFRAYCWDAS